MKLDKQRARGAVGGPRVRPYTADRTGRLGETVSGGQQREAGPIAVVLIAVVAVIILIVLGVAPMRAMAVARAATPRPARPRERSGQLRLSPEKEQLLEPLIDEFNASETEVEGGRSSSRARSSRAARRSRRSPTASSSPSPGRPHPASGAAPSTTRPTEDLTAEDAPSIVRTPLVIAMWEPMARALGWPDEGIGFEDILALARSDDGWAAYGRPEFGDFKLVHTNPDFSTSGLSAVVAEYYAATGKSEGLVEADIDGARPGGGSRHRALDRPLRGHHPFHRRPDARGGAELRIGGRDGGGHAAGLQPRSRRPAASWLRSTPRRGPSSPTTPSSSSTVSGCRRSEPGPRLSRRSSPTGDARARRRVGLPPRRSRRAARRADHGRERRRSGAARADPLAALAARCWRRFATLARGPKAREGDAGRRRVGLDGGHNRLEHAKEGLTGSLKEIQPQDQVGLTAFDNEVDELVPIGPFDENRGRILGRSPACCRTEARPSATPPSRPSGRCGGRAIRPTTSTPSSSSAMARTPTPSAASGPSSTSSPLRATRPRRSGSSRSPTRPPRTGRRRRSRRSPRPAAGRPTRAARRTSSASTARSRRSSRTPRPRELRARAA